MGGKVIIILGQPCQDLGDNLFAGAYRIDNQVRHINAVA
jgi:hypothetical protein